ncbi:MarR family winged helix-turn-helix transcriptional regulator [Levilinea saccharolytica]|uniref:MarR family winged helix-turn-helix transcriptional regulator n=2 Tax=Levilinea saccharolytica TaxID=229921 RepID=UPI0009E2A12A|nr:MarR family winged helix-turn-helix transcriptional regulator [Levilinea saccharolytica]GAP18864.1 transcriptional regulator [Levilinea saccharolytica]
MRSINRHVSLLFRMGERFLNRRLAGSGITSGTAPLLLELRGGEGRSPAALSAAIGVDKAHITRALQSLKQSGYVAIVPDVTDRRSIAVSLTPQGQAAVEKVEEAMRAWIAIVSRDVSQADVDTVNAVFDQFYANAQQFFRDGST